MRFNWKTIAPLVVWLVIYLVPIPSGLNANQWHYFAVFAAVITGLVLESMPVGRLRLVTRPNGTGSDPTVKTMGMAVVAD